MASSSSSSSSRLGHPQQQQQLQRASSAPVAGAEASTSSSAKSNVKLSVTNKALTTSAKRSVFSHLVSFSSVYNFFRDYCFYLPQEVIMLTVCL